MKRLFAAALCLIMAFSVCAFSEAEAPVYEKAMPLYEILLSSDTFYNFDGVPDEAMAREAVYRLREKMATPSEPISNEDAYKMIFAEGEYIEYEGEEAETYLPPLPLEIGIESAVESGVGTIIVSVRVEKDFGFGMELWGYADIHILPDETAPFFARVTRVFIPE